MLILTISCARQEEPSQSLCWKCSIRLIIDQIKETDKEDYFINISHDKKVLDG